MPIKCLIVDDEKLARELIVEYITKIPDLEKVDACSNALAAQSTLRKESIDLLFLDIQMPHLTGLEFLKSLKNPPLVILTTAYSEYALEAFDYEVVDYLLKPIVFERFFQAIEKVLNRIEKNPTPRIHSEISSIQSQTDYIFIKADGIIHKIQYRDILYIESLREYIRIHTSEKRLVFRQALSQLLQKLPENQFFRIHRSYIINLEQIENIEGNMVRIGGHRLSISKRKKEAFLEAIQRKGLIE